LRNSQLTIFTYHHPYSRHRKREKEVANLDTIFTQPENLAGVTVALGIFLIFLGLALYIKYRRWQERLHQLIGRHLEATSSSQDTSPEILPQKALLSWRIREKLKDIIITPKFRRELLTAGLGIAADKFILIRLAGALLCSLLVMLLIPGNYPLFRTIAAIFGLIAGYQLPRAYLALRRKRRLSALERQLPDAIDVLAGALEAGSSLAQAMMLAAREMSNPISDELIKVVRDQELGLSQEEALRRMLERCPSEDLDMMITAINIQYRVGGSLAHVLKSISTTIRERLRIKGEIKVLTAQGRISAYIVTAIPFLLTAVIFLLNRSYIMPLFTTNMGRIMLAVALAGIMMGYYMMRRIIAIKV